MPVGPGFDVGDDPIASFAAPFKCRRAEMGQGDNIGQPKQPAIYIRLVTVNVEPRATEPSIGQRVDKSGLVDQCSSRCVHDICGGLHQRDSAGIQQVFGVGPCWTILGKHIGFGDQLVESRFVSRTQLSLQPSVQPASVMVGNL